MFYFQVHTVKDAWSIDIELISWIEEIPNSPLTILSTAEVLSEPVFAP